ncbi:MAG: type I DNA topoisomerase [Gammaproteobacteria bacterium]|nr:type I DNA topoisomerase [Gammaproteobacteria bacterium]
MAKSLVIVESPAKARTINRYLGPEYVVKSCVGHIRDLPEKGRTGQQRRGRSPATSKLSPEQKKRRQLVQRLGVDPNGWRARYEILPGKEQIVEDLKKVAAGAESIYLASDRDREGEAIAWHLQEAIGGDPSRFRRVVFNEITRKAIREAFADTGEVDMRYVEEQQARRFLDRVVGYMLSPLLWAKVARGLSAGRVQSVAVRLIVEREREIRAFNPEEYWEIFADLETGAKQQLRCQVFRQSGKNFRPGNQQAADQALAVLRGADYVVSKREDKPTTSRPRPPLITSTLQQAASTRLGFGVSKTMTLAQRLYQAGHITYMRTDSTHLSDEAIAAARAHIEQRFGADYLPPKPNFYRPREGAQEAHEAIRPTDVGKSAEALGDMDTDARRLYQLIHQFFVACQMVPARFLATTITVGADVFELRAKGRIMRFPGFLAANPTRETDVVLPDVAMGETLALQKLDPKQNFTRPPPRFTEASLVKELEKREIGRPSTYAATISTIQDRGYVKLENKRFHALKIGDIVTERLRESFQDLMDYDFTARMEDSLDEVAAGRRNWKELLDEFYRDFTAQLAKAEAQEGGMRANNPIEVDVDCPQCGRKMQIRNASTGVFLGCSAYGLPGEQKCRATINLTPGEEAIRADSAEEAEQQENIQLRNKHRCPLCGTAMDAWLIDNRRKLHVCGNNPDCKGFELEQGEFQIQGYDGPVIECDKCGSDMQLKSGRFGKYFGCTNSDCRNTRKLLRNGQPAPPKMDPVPMPELRCEKVDDHYILREGASGLFLAASGFPRNRETRSPKVAELLPHRKAIDPKFHYLLDAPAEDDKGNPTVVGFSRKTRQHFVQSIAKGKPTGWRAFHRDGKWQASAGKNG